MVLGHFRWRSFNFWRAYKLDNLSGHALGGSIQHNFRYCRQRYNHPGFQQDRRKKWDCFEWSCPWDSDILISRLNVLFFSDGWVIRGQIPKQDKVIHAWAFIGEQHTTLLILKSQQRLTNNVEVQRRLDHTSAKNLLLLRVLPLQLPIVYTMPAEVVYSRYQRQSVF